MQLRLFCLRLPIKRRIAYSDVVHLAVVNREAWWTRFQTTRGFSQESFMFRVGTPDYRTPMPTIGSRYVILMTLRGGKTVEIEAVTSSDVARWIEKQLRKRIGLPEIH